MKIQPNQVTVITGAGGGVGRCLAESDNLERSTKNFQMAQRLGVTPEHAIDRIIKGIERNKVRIRIGKDSIIEILKCIMPKALLKPMVLAFRTTRG